MQYVNKDKRGGEHMAKDTISDQARQARNEYYRKYRREHPEQTKAINKRYWEKKAKEKQTQTESGDNND